LLNCWWN